jgi:methionyl-tRNA formyltransferase
VTPRSFYAYSPAPSPADRTPLFTAHGERVIDAELLSRIAAVQPDVIVVAAFGMILPARILSLPRFGCINIHASLLPRWRGAAPIQRCILAGDECTGVSIMRMEEGLDTGAVCRVGTLPATGKNARVLTEELAELGAALLLDVLPRVVDGSAEWTEQDEAQVTYADKVEKRELALDPASSALTNLRRVLASTPQAPARCVLDGRPVTVLEARLWEGAGEPPFCGAEGLGTPAGLVAAGAPAAPADPAAPVVLAGKSLLLATAEGCLELISLKPDGRQGMPAAAFAAGVRGLQKGAGGQPPVFWHAIDGGSA